MRVDLAVAMTLFTASVLSIAASLSSNPAPIVEWDLQCDENNSCMLHLELLGSGHGELTKLSLVPHDNTTSITVINSPSSHDGEWSSSNALNWMWHGVPQHVAIDVNLTKKNGNIYNDETALDVIWEHVADGQRERLNLGTVRKSLDEESQALVKTPSGERVAKTLDNGELEIQLHVADVLPGSFVKWTEYIPEDCSCRVTETSGSSHRINQNKLIFLWFQVIEHQHLQPHYVLNCEEPRDIWNFSGDLEIAFGTETKTSHIAKVEWVGPEPTQSENMELNQSTDNQLVDLNDQIETEMNPSSWSQDVVSFAVQLLANHRDLSPRELADATDYTDSFHIYRHEGWHKYLTDETTTYASARDLRSLIWSTTKATDAFVTASLNGERITVQEALLMTNQTWIP